MSKEAAAASTMIEEYQKAKQMKILGVCGGIGSGKSAACKLLVSDLGCAAHIDADLVAHAVYEPNSPAIQAIVDEFGSTVLKSNTEQAEIDRPALGSIVFADRSKMARLERLVWPFAKQEIQNRIQSIADTLQQGEKGIMEAAAAAAAPPAAVPPTVVVVEAAMMLDAGWQDILDGLWIVTVSTKVAIDRLIEQRGMSREDAEKRITAQASRRGIGNLSEEVSKGTVSAIIENNGPIDELKQSLSQKLNDPAAWYGP